MMKRLFAIIVFLASITNIFASTSDDSIRVEQILAKALLMKDHEARVLYVAREFLGTPYVAHTLDRSTTESLVINTAELDCTTYVENVVTICLCAGRGERTFADYKRQLQRLRYKDGNVAYTSRLHYFTTWIEENERMGFVSKVQSKKAPFSAIQKLNVDYMTKHYTSYYMLNANKEWLPQIRETEKELTGRSYRFIPKDGIYNNKLLRNTIHDGDIIAILTSIQGLDTSHIGIAVWHKDGLHLLNASQIHKKVVEESLTLRNYMKQHKKQTGIRVCRIASEK